MLSLSLSICLSIYQSLTLSLSLTGTKAQQELAAISGIAPLSQVPGLLHLRGPRGPWDGALPAFGENQGLGFGG